DAAPDTRWRVLPARQGASDATGTPAALPPARSPAPTGAEARAASSPPADPELGRGADHEPDAGDSPSPRGTNDDTAAYRAPRAGGDTRPGGCLPHAGHTSRATAPRVAPSTQHSPADVDRDGRAAAVEPGEGPSRRQPRRSAHHRGLPSHAR